MISLAKLFSANRTDNSSRGLMITINAVWPTEFGGKKMARERFRDSSVEKIKRTKSLLRAALRSERRTVAFGVCRPTLFVLLLDC